jgi:hypothetical protein
VDPTRFVGLIGASLVFVLLCLGLGWGPLETAPSPERIALLGLAATGLIWPAIVIGIVGRARRLKGSSH